MKKTFSDSELESIHSRHEIRESNLENSKSHVRAPIHVVYGGAHLFKAETPRKLGKLALKSLETYAPNFVEFAKAIWLKGADTLPVYEDAITAIEKDLRKNPEKVKQKDFNSWFAWTVYRRTIEKLEKEPVEDFRIDFEDGYGFRTDEEEDKHSISASDELAKSFLENTITPFCGFRIKSFQEETFGRALRTLNLFLSNFLEKTGGKLPENFVLTLPKIAFEEEVETLDKLLSKFEERKNLENGAIKIEILIETPQAILNQKGKIALPNLVKAANGRCTSAHFGAYDYTASLGIAGVHQHLRHEACNFARQMMLIYFSPLDIRISDSVTTEMPIPVHKGENLSENQLKENKRVVQKAWRSHFNNVTHSLINGFYQSWDLHPAQLAARYAAVYSFFLESKDEQAKRLKGFIKKATQAMTTGNQFDDAASAQGLLNFFSRALNSGAMTEAEILEATGMEARKLSSSFGEIIQDM